MAAIERVTMGGMGPGSNLAGEGDYGLSRLGLPGLRISSRATTSSLSDYPEWNIEELYQHYREALITDGTCS